MEKHRALIIGAGRIGAGWDWGDDAYTHAGAYRALRDRVELVGFVEPDRERRMAACVKWGVSGFLDLQSAICQCDFDIVSICTQPESQADTLKALPAFVKAVWCEKPYMGPAKYPVPIQVNYIRRADPVHRFLAPEDMPTLFVYGADKVRHPIALESRPRVVNLTVYGKDDIHTRCHFEDLAKWWKCTLDYRVYEGPCAYIVQGAGTRFFDQGGVNGGECMKGMLGNLLDHLDNGTPLWSPAP